MSRLVKKILKVDGKEEQLKEFWAELVKSNTSGVCELDVNHSIDCNCCTRIIRESYTRPTKAESKRERRPGRPRLRRERK